MILPLQDKILCRRIKEETQSLIALPENHISYEPYYAEVLAVGGLTAGLLQAVRVISKKVAIRRYPSIDTILCFTWE